MDDVNNDDNIDLATAGNGLRVWLGDGAGGWTESSNGLPGLFDIWNSVTFGDIDLDGNLDIASAKYSGGAGIKAWLGDGSGNWAEISTGLPTTGVFYSVVLADLAGDKYPDMLAADFDGNGIRLWKGDGGTSWSEEFPGLPTIGQFIGADAGDIDNDGYNDIVGVGQNVEVQVWRRDEPTPPLTVAVEEPNGGENWEVGAQKSIKWSATGGSAPLTMRIEYSVDGIVGTYTIESDGETNDGSYTWTVPNPPSLPALDCWVRVNVTDNLGLKNWDKSDEAFAIRTPDLVLPSISNLQPANQSVVFTETPGIGANYSDLFGINTSAVVLEVDTIDVTASATVNEDGILYTPAIPLSDGIHNIYLEVKDDTINGNLNTTSWWFEVDTPPTVQVWEPGGSSGQTHTQGDTIQVLWNATDANPFPPNPINITYGSGSTWNSVTNDETNDGVYLWDTSGVPCPANYWMNISAYDSMGMEGYGLSNFSFDIFCPGDSPPVITAWEPGGVIGQTFVQGDDIIVTWTANDNNPLPPDPINITYGDSIGGWTTVALNEANDLQYLWDTSSVPCPGTYWMNISVYDSIGQTVFDMSNNSFELTCPDLTPPAITVINPANESTIGFLSSIAAAFNDLSGIDSSTVVLKLDAVDVTSSATMFPTGISYTPSSLADGYHEVYLEVKDSSPAKNKATVAWWFILDTTQPEITNLMPGDDSVVGERLPTIRASYYDDSGIDLNTVIVRLNGVNLTSIATINPDHIALTPLLQLNEGQHNVFLRVGDNSEPINYNFSSWRFFVDATPPIITNILPLNNSGINNNMPTIAADYSDSSSINVTSIVLKIDNVDVSAYATANQTWMLTIDTSLPVIIHDPVTTGNAGEDVTVTAKVSDNIGISSVDLYYRTSPGSSYVKVHMTENSQGKYAGTIPGADVAGDTIQYYIEAKDIVNNTVRRPLTNWEQSPYSIEISSIPWLLIALLAVIIILVVLISLVLLSSRKGKTIKEPEEQEYEELDESDEEPDFGDDELADGELEEEELAEEDASEDLRQS
jgi:hypothetical protein